MRQRASHQQLLLAGNPFHWQRIDQPCDILEMRGGSQGVTPPSGKQRAQIRNTRLRRRKRRKCGEVLVCLRVATKVNQDARSRDARIQVVGLDRNRPFVVPERIRQLSRGMCNRGTCIQRLRAVGRQFNGTVCHAPGIAPLARSDQNGHFSHQWHDRSRVYRTRIGEGARGLGRLAQRSVGLASQHQDFQPRRSRQTVGRNRVDQQLRLALHQIDAPQRHRHFGTIHPQLERFPECHLGRPHVAVCKIGLGQQQMRGEHVSILLQRVLELDDRPWQILLAVAGQTVLVVTAGLDRVRLNRKRKRQKQRQSGNSNGAGISAVHDSLGIRSKMYQAFNICKKHQKGR